MTEEDALRVASLCEAITQQQQDERRLRQRLIFAPVFIQFADAWLGEDCPALNPFSQVLEYFPRCDFGPLERKQYADFIDSGVRAWNAAIRNGFVCC